MGWAAPDLETIPSEQAVSAQIRSIVVVSQIPGVGVNAARRPGWMTTGDM
jgi:hypothetical protein